MLMKRLSKIVLVLYSLLFLATTFHIHKPGWNNLLLLSETQKSDSQIFHVNQECSLTYFRSFISGYFTSEFELFSDSKLIQSLSEIQFTNFCENSSFIFNPRAPPEFV